MLYWSLRPGAAVIYVNSCPKCFGAMALESDAYGPYFSCLNCGHHRELVKAAPGSLKQDRMVNPGRVIEAAPAARDRGSLERVVVIN